MLQASCVCTSSFPPTERRCELSGVESMVDPNLMLALDTYALCRTSVNNRGFDRLSVTTVFNDCHVSVFLFFFFFFYLLTSSPFLNIKSFLMELSSCIISSLGFNHKKFWWF